MRDLVSEDLKPAALNREHPGVDPVAARVNRMRHAKELRLAFTRLPTLCFDHKLVCIDQCDVGNEQWREIDLRHEQRVEIDVHDRAGFASEDGIEL